MLDFLGLDIRPAHTAIYSNIDVKNGYDKNKLFDELMSIMVNVKDLSKYIILEKAYVLNIGKIGNIERHITIVFGIQNSDLHKLKQIN